MEAIILAGGMGTRIRERVPDLPKVLAPVNGVPFLDYVLNMLVRYGVDRFILAVGYKAPAILSRYGSEYMGVPVDYSFESSPLGTGGAIKSAMAFCTGERCIVVNGDTLCDVNLSAMEQCHIAAGRAVTVCVKPMRGFERYGNVEVKDGRVKAFHEKEKCEFGKINAGVYIVEKKLIDSIDKSVFSFERDVLENTSNHITAFETNGYFIDIGVPQDYDRAQQELSRSIKVGAVFLDRDGTLNSEVDYLSSPEDFRFIYGAARALRAIHCKGYLAIVVTNQAGVAKGYYAESAIGKLHGHIDRLLKKEGTYIDAYYYCPHHPNATVEKYRLQCPCRKPGTGMIEKAVSDFAAKGIEIDLAASLMVGDTENDILTGKNAGIGKCVLVRTGHPADEKNTAADTVIDSIADIEQVL